jgi:hypothetical protein
MRIGPSRFHQCTEAANGVSETVGLCARQLQKQDASSYIASTAVLDAAAAAAIFRSLRASGTKSQRRRKRRRPAAQLPPHCTQQGVHASASRQWQLAHFDFALHRRRELATDVHLRRAWGDPMQLGASKRLGNTHG